jgi:hypothetical protein
LVTRRRRIHFDITLLGENGDVLLSVEDYVAHTFAPIGAPSGHQAGASGSSTMIDLARRIGRPRRAATRTSPSRRHDQLARLGSTGDRDDTRSSSPVEINQELAVSEPDMAAVSIQSSLVWRNRIPSLERWLTPAERATYHSFEVPKRRRGLACRKNCREGRTGPPADLAGTDAFQRIEIRALPDGPQRGRPVYRIDGVAGRLGLP